MYPIAASPDELCRHQRSFSAAKACPGVIDRSHREGPRAYRLSRQSGKRDERLEPSSLTAREARDFKCLRAPPQAPCLRRPGLFSFGLHATGYNAIQRLPLGAHASLSRIGSPGPLSARLSQRHFPLPQSSSASRFTAGASDDVALGPRLGLHRCVGQALATEAIAERIRSGGVWEAESNIELL